MSMAGVETKARGKRKEREGRVLNRSGDKSVVVQVERHKRHPLYGKVVRQTKRLHAHDESNQVRPGDRVRIVETRPLSRTKRWRIIEILDRGSELTE